MTKIRERIHYDYPYRLRLYHDGEAGIRVERRGRTLLFDPILRPDADAIVLLTSPLAERLAATREAAAAGVRPTVIAPDGVIDWLNEAGRVEGGSAPRTIDGLKIDSLSFTPRRDPPRLSALLRTGPATAIRTITGRMRLPSAEPQILCVTFEDGTRLLHLDLSLHRATSPDWIARAAGMFGAPEWLLIGVPHGEGDALVQWLPRFQPRRVLLTDLVNTQRRRLGQPIELITPLRDRLITAGLETHVFAPQASYRFE